MTEELYVGLLSGTSMDGIDAAVVAFGDRSCRIVHALTCPYPDDLARDLRACIETPEDVRLDALGRLDARCGTAFAEAALALLDAARVPRDRITAIGSHGQTVRHRPDGPAGFTLQIGDPARIAVACGLPVVADFRRADVALGGQGAPLAPAFHRWAFGDSGEDLAVVNIGGIANLTLLPRTGRPLGFDTGPGNTLLDLWHRRHRGGAFDADGSWAASGQVDESLLLDMLGDAYFARPAPKSTGREDFHARWLDDALRRRNAPLAPADVQATLAELTAASIAMPVAASTATSVAVCGGGASNADLMRRLHRRLADRRVASTTAWGVDPDWVEAATFAWLARERLARRPGNLPSVTGASRPACLGAVHRPV